MIEKSQYIYETYFGEKLFLLNLMTFKYTILNVSDSLLWKENHIDRISIKERLKQDLFIVPSEDFWESKIERLVKKHKISPSHTIFITDECNQKCPYCFEKDSQSLRKYNKTLSTEQVNNIIKTIKLVNARYDPNDNRITLFGGEPLLEKNHGIVEYILQKLESIKGSKVNIVTNGITLDRYFDLVRKYQHRILSIIVTLNGYKELHELIRGSEDNPTFLKIVSNIRALLDSVQYVSIGINIMLEKRNVENVESLLNFLEKEGLLSNKRVMVRFGRIQSRTNPENFFYQYELPYEDYYPALIRKYFSPVNSHITTDMFEGSEVGFLGKLLQFWIDNRFIFPELKGCEAVYPGRYCYYVDGKIYPCTEIVGNDQFVIGSYDNSIIYEDKIAPWRNYDVLQLEKCKTCKFIGMCDGACPVTNKMMLGRIDDIYCLRMEEALEKVIRQLYEMGFFNA